MKLSMTMLAWYMKDLAPIVQITNDIPEIEAMRIARNPDDASERKYVYYCETELSLFHAGSVLHFPTGERSTILNAALSAFDFFHRLEEELSAVAARNAPLEQFLAIMEPVLENPLLIANLDGSFCMSSSNAGHTVDPLWESITTALSSHPALYAPYFSSSGERIRELSSTPQLVRNVFDGGAPVMMMYIEQNEEAVGSLSILQEKPELTGQNLQLAPFFARYCTQAEEFVAASGPIRSGSAVFQSLLSGEDIGERNAQRLKCFFGPPPWRLLQLQLSERTDRLAKNALWVKLCRSKELLPLEQDDCFYAVIGEHTLQRCLRSSTPFLGLNGVSIGASMPFSDLHGFAMRRQQAEFAATQAGKQSGLYLCEAYACDYLLQEFRSLELTSALLHPALETLRRYDAENRSELRKTLSVYLHQERNQLLSSNELHIHPNTMRYRLQRIVEITGLTLENADELKYLRLSDWLE